jgi:hypothetical protein
MFLAFSLLVQQRQRMWSQRPEKVVENLRRKLHARIPYYASLLPDMRHGDVEHELVDLAVMLGAEWPGDWSPPTYQRQRRQLCALLDSLMAAAREDQEAMYRRRISKMMANEPAGEAVPPVTAAVDRWLERWLSGKEAGRLP